MAAEAPLAEETNMDETEVGVDIKLIELYENEPSLWDTTSKNYLDKNERRKALERIDNHMQCGVDKILKKINNIRTYYRKEVNKTEDSKRSGSGYNDVYESKWPMYSALDKFLRPMVKKKKSRSNISCIPQDEDNSIDEVDLNDSNDSIPTPFKKRKTTVVTAAKKSQSDLLLKKALDSLNQDEEENDDICFARYIGSSLASMPNDIGKCLLKNKIQNLLCDAQISNLQQKHQQRQVQPSPMSSYSGITHSEDYSQMNMNSFQTHNDGLPSTSFQSYQHNLSNCSYDFQASNMHFTSLSECFISER